MQKSNFDLNDDIEKYLIQYGWHAERKIDIKSVIETWKADNYRVFDSAIFFVQSFNELNIVHEAYRGKEKDTSCFNSIKGNDLLPIGLGYSEHLTYFIDSSFKFYGGYDDYFCYIGDSVNSFFNNLFYEKNFITL